MEMDKEVVNNRMTNVGSDEKKKIIRIEKDKIKRSIKKYLKKNDIVLFAGTFDKVHLGHVLLIFYSIFLSNKFIYIGLYNNKNLSHKKCSIEIDDFNLRLFNISNILLLIKNVYQMNFFFMNDSNILPFLKLKNAHKIFYELVNCQREKVKLEWKRGKYKKYVTSCFKDKENDKNTKNARNDRNVTNHDIYGKLMKYLFLINNRIDIHFRKKKKVPENVSIIKKEKRKILRYLCFYIEATENKNYRHRKKKVIVLKKIYDAFDLVLDIKDSLSMTLSRETEPNGVAVWEKRKTKFEQNKMKWLERQRIQHQQNQQERQIMAQLCGRGFKQEKDTEQSRGQVVLPTQKFYNVCDKCDQLPDYTPTTWRKNNITILNVFDTIDLNIGEKVSATRIRKENIWLKEKKGSKLLRHFISACLFFDVEIFLIEKYVNLFLQRKIEKSENNRFLKKVKGYFCKKKWAYEERKDKKQNIDKRQLNEKYINNDFFRNVFILLSFFINHFMDGSSKYKVPFFIKISVALCYFFYDNINLLIIKREEKRVNENGLKPYVTMLNNHSENIFRTYINNVDEHFLLQIINQLLIMTILLLSLSILCNLFQYVHNKKSKANRKSDVDEQGDADKQNDVDKPNDVDKQNNVNKQNDVEKKDDSNTQVASNCNKTVEKNANDAKLVTLHKTHKSDMKIKRINKNSIKYPYFIYMLIHFLNTVDVYSNKKKRKCKQKELCDGNSNTVFSKHNVEHATSSLKKKKAETPQSKYSTKNLLNKTHTCQGHNIKKTIESYYQQVISERKKWNKEGLLIDKKKQVEIANKENEYKEKQNNVSNNGKCLNLEHKNIKENLLSQSQLQSQLQSQPPTSPLTSFFVNNYDARQGEQCAQDVLSDTRYIHTNCRRRTNSANMNTHGSDNMDGHDKENKRLEEFNNQIIYSDDNDTPLFRKTQIYKYVDNYLIDFFRFHSVITLKLIKNKKKHTYPQNKNFDDLLFIFLINFEKHVEIIINSYIVQKWEMVKRKQKNDHFDVYNKYMNTFSIIHKFLNTNISPFNNFQDFEKTYDSNKKKNKSYKNTPFYIKKLSFKYTNIFSFYYVIFQHISEQKNYYYPYFAMLNILLD